MKSLLASIVLLAAACGSKPTGPTTTTGSASPVEKTDDTVAAGSGSGSAEMPKETPPPPEEKKEEPPPPPPPPPELDAFMKLTKEEKTKIMKTKVLPWAAKAFKAHDAKKYAKVTCKTCHGKGAEGDFKMPNPDLPPLDFEAMKNGTASKDTMKMAEWMGKVVKPEMAKALGVEQYDDAHPNGFGCLACHTMKK